MIHQRINYLSNTLKKKGNELPQKALKVFQFHTTKKNTNSAVLINSLPKSGTYLLINSINFVSKYKFYGSFIAQTPSLSMKQKTQTLITKELSYRVNREIVGSHIYYSTKSEENIKSLHYKNIFIYRNPLDVAVSEAYYLRYMNIFHKWHIHFKHQTSDRDAILLSIYGNKQRGIENIVERVKKYSNWVNSKTCLSIKYEDLLNMNSGSHKQIADLLEFSRLEEDKFKSLFADGIKNKISSHTRRSDKEFSIQNLIEPNLKKEILSFIKNEKNNCQIISKYDY